MTNLFSAKQSAAEIREGKRTVLEHVQACLANIHKKNGELNALRWVNEGGALTRAAELDGEVRSGRPLGRLHGLTFCVKDHINVRGTPRSEGTLQGAIDNDPQQAAVVDRLIEEGAICLGKGNMAEYAKSFFTDNPAFGRSSNPADKERTPGGSGGGDAAAVAAQMVDFAIGTDGAGSLRVPANFCGIAALYPTQGTISSAGLTAFTHTVSHLFRSLGPLTRTISDLELLHSVLCHYDRRDPYSVPEPTGLTPSPTKRFAFFTKLNGVECDAQLSAAVRSYAGRLEALGFKATEIVPAQFEQIQAQIIVLAGQAGLILGDRIAEKSGAPRNLAAEGVHMQMLRKRISSELPALSAEDLLERWYTIDRLRHEITPFFEEYDFMLYPVAATFAPKHNTAVYEINGSQYRSESVYHFAGLANALALPALAFPVGKSRENLPLGLQIMGARFSDRMLLQVVCALGNPV